ncbi:hypothetical protein [Rhizobium sp. RU36D]|uniref:hypothetical protein n=1 Tax=Rhizobium sp. RU36D TaxID=1907415 RepID=UPI00117A8A97|nr:hypothetical protein [Rhizobium sp. RU36D]
MTISIRRYAIGTLLSAAAFALPLQALALSELKPGPGQPPVASDTVDPNAPATMPLPGDGTLPSPDPLINNPDAEDEQAAPPSLETPQDNADRPVEIFQDIASAPEPVRRMRQMIVEAAASGDFARLKPLLNPGPNQTQVTAADTGSDPLEAVRALSGDTEGMEILAIMLDVLQSGFVRVDAGTPDEAYVWPYFAEKSITTLTPPEKVELLRIVTAGDFADMQEYGNYNFFRLGITPDGQWKFLTAGD